MSHQLDIPVMQWRRHDIGPLRDLLNRIGADPETARAWRGSVVLHFEEENSYNPYLNPGVAGFLKNAYSEFPHLFYFLDPDLANAPTDGFFTTIGALQENQFGAWIIWSDEVADAFYNALADAAEYAIQQGDDWVAVVEGYEYDERQTRFKEIEAILIDRKVITG
jgi:hypothetical protein